MVDGTTQYTVVSEVDNFYESEKWTHVVVLFDSSNSVCRIFRNGEEQTVSGSGGKITAGSDPKYIGFNSPNTKHLSGAELDEVSPSHLPSPLNKLAGWLKVKTHVRF